VHGEGGLPIRLGGVDGRVGGRVEEDRRPLGRHRTEDGGAVFDVELRFGSTRKRHAGGRAAGELGAELTRGTNDQRLHGYTSAPDGRGAAASLELKSSSSRKSGHSIPISGSSQRIDRSCSGA